MDLVTLAAAKKYANQVVASVNAGIDHYEVVDQVLWIYCIDGTILNMPFPSPISVASLRVNSDKQLIVILSDGTELEPVEVPTIEGKSAYEVAVKNGFRGTEQEWLASLVGKAPTYEFLQEDEEETWEINHNLDRQYPIVTCFNNEGDEIIGDITYVDKNNLKIEFYKELKGKVIIR